MTEICKHCNMPIAIRNPSGVCDHLEYPRYCNICQERAEAEAEMDTLEAQGQAEMDAIAKEEADRARDEDEQREWENSQGPEGDDEQ